MTSWFQLKSIELNSPTCHCTAQSIFFLIASNLNAKDLISDYHRTVGYHLYSIYILEKREKFLLSKNDIFFHFFSKQTPPVSFQIWMTIFLRIQGLKIGLTLFGSGRGYLWFWITTFSAEFSSKLSKFLFTVNLNKIVTFLTPWSFS